MPLKARRALILGVFAALAVCVWIYRKPVVFISAALLGRSSYCSVAQVAHAPSHYALLWKQAERDTAARCSVIGTDAGMRLWKTSLGEFWAPQNAGFVPFDVMEQELHIYGVGPQAVQRGDVVLDCGANIGLFTRVALRAGARRVVAIEPDPQNLACLRRNLRGEIASGTVIVVEKGVWDREGALTFISDGSNSAASYFSDTGNPSAGQLPVTTIDAIVRNLALDRVGYIKMDIEGGERHALAGARNTLASFKPRLAICTYHKPDDPEVIPALITKINPAYALECGRCTFKRQSLTLVPEVVFFR